MTALTRQIQLETMATVLIAGFLVCCTSASGPMMGNEWSPEQKNLYEEKDSVWLQTKHDKLKLPVCDDASFPDEMTHGSWQRGRSRIASNMPSIHAGLDVLTTGGEDVVLSAKFGHGPVVKDLEQELVQVWLDDCGEQLRYLGTKATDDDGRVEFVLGADSVPDYGHYQVFFRLLANGTGVGATLRVLPAGTRVVVFDIDGTLTTGTWQTARDTLAVLSWSGFMPELREGAVETTRHRTYEQGYVPVYLTGRPYWMTQRTRRWLNDAGAAVGHLKTTETWSDWTPTSSGVGEFKAQYLDELQQMGFDIAIAYGNVASDVEAYRSVGLGASQIFVVDDGGDVEESTDKTGVTNFGDDFVNHLNWLQRPCEKNERRSCHSGLR